jgi:ribosomal-protein-alanine N-acetyltransferase
VTIKIEISISPDVEALARIHRQCFDQAWNAAAISEMLAINGTVVFVAEDYTAFGILRHVANEAEMLTLAVLPSARNRGIASLIVNTMRVWSQKEGITAIFLEVAKPNHVAIKLYEKYEFSVISRRKDYYLRADGTHEDALVMRCILAP